MDWLWTNEVAPFSFALLLMFGLGLIEIFGLMLGISSLTHSPDVDVDANLHLDGAGHGFSQFLSWLHIGRAPFLILLVFFLLGFGLSGLLLQQLSQSVLGFLLHGGLVAIPSTLIGLTHMNWGGRFVNRYLPKDETESISSSRFIGQTVTITVGEARINDPAEAKFKDAFGHTHYVMVEPDDDSFYLKQGEQALIIRQEGSIYRVVPNLNYLLTKTRSNSQ
jgi:hypothetical protein